MTGAWRHCLARELGEEALFDEGVEAARNACVAGASIAAAAITAAAWYDNPLTGMPALGECMRRLAPLPDSVDAWRSAFAPARHPETLDADFSPGFGFVTPLAANAVLAALGRLSAEPGAALRRSRFFLAAHDAITRDRGRLNQAGLAALVCLDHDIDVETAEREFLLCRMATALEQASRARRAGVAVFPFFSETYVYEGARPEPRRFDTRDLLARVGLE